jgi:hypothetical protein
MSFRDIGSQCRRIGIILLPLAAVSLLAWALASCSTIITPQAALSEPVDVFVVDHGRTTSLVIPASDGKLLRYAYGDWDWYALGKHSVWRAIVALLWPTQGALGRGLLEGPATAGSIRLQVTEIEEIHRVPVERTLLIAFEAKMEALHERGRGAAVSNSEVDMIFVHHPHAYSVVWNSNHAVASWLRELGSKTSGCSPGANWRVKDIANRSAISPPFVQAAEGVAILPPGSATAVSRSRWIAARSSSLSVSFASNTCALFSSTRRPRVRRRVATANAFSMISRTAQSMSRAVASL